MDCQSKRVVSKVAFLCGLSGCQSKRVVGKPIGRDCAPVPAAAMATGAAKLA